MSIKLQLHGSSEENEELACRLRLIADIVGESRYQTDRDQVIYLIEVSPDDGLIGRLTSLAAVLLEVADESGGGVAEHLEAAVEHIIRALHILGAEARPPRHS